MLTLIERWFERLLRLVAYAGGLVLVGLMFLVIYEVTMRYFFGRPFRGGYELTELAMSLIVAFGMPYTAIKRGHVSVDLLSNWLDRPAMRWLSTLVHLAGAAVLAFVAYRAWLHAGGSLRWGSMTNMMRIPTYPFQFAVAVSFGMFAMVLLLEAAKTLGRSGSAEQDKT